MQKEGKEPLGHTAYELTDIHAGKPQEETDQVLTAIISSETNKVQNEKGRGGGGKEEKYLLVRADSYNCKTELQLFP